MWMFNIFRTVFNKWNRPQYIVIASIYFKTFWNIDINILNTIPLNVYSRLYKTFSDILEQKYNYSDTLNFKSSYVAEVRKFSKFFHNYFHKISLKYPKNILEVISKLRKIF